MEDVDVAEDLTSQQPVDDAVASEPNIGNPDTVCVGRLATIYTYIYIERSS
jgi:hypothetical protein